MSKQLTKQNAIEKALFEKAEGDYEKFMYLKDVAATVQEVLGVANVEPVAVTETRKPAPAKLTTPTLPVTYKRDPNNYAALQDGRVAKVLNDLAKRVHRASARVISKSSGTALTCCREYLAVAVNLGLAECLAQDGSFYFRSTAAGRLQASKPQPTAPQQALDLGTTGAVVS